MRNPPARKGKAMRTDIYEKITNQIVSELEKGVRPWMKPWNVEHSAGRITRPLRGNGIPYQGINVLMLWSAAIEKGYAAPVWMTFKQALELKASVRKGEHGSLVVYADRIIRTETDTATGEEAERAIPFMKGYTVFNVEQIDGLPEHFYSKPAPRVDTVQRIERAESFLRATGANTVHGGSRACYILSTDNIHMPCIDFFRDAESYYATLAHETTHWTRHPSRLDRDFGRKRFGDEGYAMEELVAELGSAFICADLDLTPELRTDHAAYIGSWIKVLKNDKRAIFTAASHAQRAADFLHGLQKRVEDGGSPANAA
jgi:antirestriction protein ArdC